MVLAALHSREELEIPLMFRRRKVIMVEVAPAMLPLLMAVAAAVAQPLPEATGLAPLGVRVETELPRLFLVAVLPIRAAAAAVIIQVPQHLAALVEAARAEVLLLRRLAELSIVVVALVVDHLQILQAAMAAPALSFSR
jgi:hypothetical protein